MTNDRVQIPAWSDQWMQGDRYGVIVGWKGNIARIKLDKSGRIVRFDINDCTPVLT